MVLIAPHELDDWVGIIHAELLGNADYTGAELLRGASNLPLSYLFPTAPPLICLPSD
jgi:hypothetical protein